MYRRFLQLLFLSISLVIFPCINLHAEEFTNSVDLISSPENKTHYTIRLGQGGFSDSRSPENSLGGGQLAFDIRPGGRSVIFSLSAEYYTNSANPTHSYEISDMLVFNVLYVTPMLNSPKADFFLGGGVGRLKVPKDESVPNASTESSLLNLEAGIHWKPFEKFGFYGLYKYLYANKDVIDFSEHIVLLGITYNFIW